MHVNLEIDGLGFSFSLSFYSGGLHLVHVFLIFTIGKPSACRQEGGNCAFSHIVYTVTTHHELQCYAVALA